MNRSYHFVWVGLALGMGMMPNFALAGDSADMFGRNSFIVTDRPAVPSDRSLQHEDVLHPSQPLMRPTKDMFDRVRPENTMGGNDMFILSPAPVPLDRLYNWPKK